MQGNIHERGIRQSLDWSLVLYYVLLVLIGWVNIYASTQSAGPDSIFDFDFRAGKQFVWILSGLGLAALILFVIPPRIWQRVSLPIYGAVVLLLIAVIFLGSEVKGSHSWFQFGPVSFQPAEISKISTALLLSSFLAQPNLKISNPKTFLSIVAIIILPMLIILAEKETGSALVYVGFIFVLYRYGMSGWILGMLGLAILLFIVTLTASPYTSILILMALISFINALREKHFWKWFWILAGAVLILSLLPWIHGLISDASTAAQTRIDRTFTVNIPGKDPHVPFGFLKGFKPIYLLLVMSACALPHFIVKAFRSRDGLGYLSIAAFIAGLILVFSTQFIFDKVLQPHQQRRIEVLLGMKEDPSGVGYNVNQSMIAIGSGGFTGKGFLQGTQTTYGFVPEQSTDFIFCTVGEEWGFIGCFIVILLYVLLIARLITDAERCRDPFTSIYGYCVAACIFMHLFINVGMTIGIMPVIGIPLPLLSYGGSSLWAFTVLIFIFIALYREEKKYY